MKTEGYKVKSYSQPVKRYCQTLSLRDNPELIEAYRKAHSKEESWPEIRAEYVKWEFWKWKYTYWGLNFL